MTREEAIRWLEDIHRRFNPTGENLENEGGDVHLQALDMAIEALKAEPIRCGECENYIDRRCIEANHHVAAHGNCMNVFGAKRREL